MRIQDKIYGNFITKEPVIIDLIKSKPVQRLKNISQCGLPDKYYHLKGCGSRYDHSVGVMILLNKLGANLEEQIAGLLHDISHYAFSHVADWVFGYEKEENLQDSIHSQSFKKGDIFQILSRYSYNPKRISDFRNFKILDRDLPQLCADRIDYCLREYKYFNNHENLIFCLNSLSVHDNEIVFNNKKAAQIFGRTFFQCQKRHWGGFQAVVRYHIMSSILKEALKNKIIVKDDFLTDDKSIIKKLLQSKNKLLISELYKLKSDKINSNGIKWKELKKKKRFVDPKFIDNNQVFKLSDKDKTYARLIQS